MADKTPIRQITPYPVRMSRELRAELERLAKLHHRRLSEEILLALELYVTAERNSEEHARSRS